MPSYPNDDTKFEVEVINDGIKKIIVEGDIDAGNNMRFGVFIDEVLRDSITNIIFDLQKLHYINSMGIGTLVSNIKKIEKENKNVYFIRVPAEIGHVFEMTGLNSIFNIEEDEETAISCIED